MGTGAKAKPSHATLPRAPGLQWDAIPAFGYATVRRLEPGTTAGGIIIPDIGKHHRFVIVRSSRGYMDDGQLIESEYESGDLVMLHPESRVASGPDMKKAEGVVALNAIIGKLVEPMS